MNELSARVMSNAEVMPGVCLIWLEAPAIASTAKPGQFVMVRCGEELLLRRPFSIHQVSDDNKLAILCSVVGKGTQWLAQCKVGDRVDLFGPLGNGFTLPDKAQHILLVAGGIGIAPLRFLADEAIKEDREVTLFLGARDANCLFPDENLPSGIEVIHTTEDGSAGFQGIVTAAWASMHLQYRRYQNIQDIFACGPLPMYQSIRELPYFNDKSVQVSLEVVMGCGVGVCYGCTVKTRQGLKQVCRDGPVFNLNDILWDELNW